MKAQDPRMPHLGVDGHSEDCARPRNTVRNDHGGDLLGVQLHGRVGLEHSTVPCGRCVCQRQLHAELEAARILGPCALHDRCPGAAVRFQQPRAVTGEHLDQHRQSRVQRLTKIAPALDRAVDGIQALEEPHIPFVLGLHRLPAPLPTSKAPRQRPIGGSVIDQLSASRAICRDIARPHC